MQKNLQFPLSLFFLLSYCAAIFSTKNLSLWTILFLLQPFLIWMVVTVLHRGIPRTIREASKENAYRLDGSKSSRRASREQMEWNQVRFALYTISISATFSVDWLILLLNSDMIAVPWMTDFLPVVVTGAIGWLLLTMFFMRFAYLRILGDYYRGIRLRKDEYVECDVARLQA